MRSIIILGCAVFAGCSTPPEVVPVGDAIPIDAAPSPSDLKVEHYRFKDDVIPGAYVDRSGYSPTILIVDPANGSSSVDRKQQATLDSSKPGDPVNSQQHANNGGVSPDQSQSLAADSDRPDICPTSERDCVLAELFFGLDQFELTKVGASIIRNIDVSGKSLELIGYADAVGETDYNGQLALARANNVRDALMSAGAKEVVVRAGHEARFAGPKFRKVIIVGL